MNWEQLELELQMSKAENSKKELTLKIARSHMDIQRMEEHMGKQDKIIEGVKEKLKELT